MRGVRIEHVCGDPTLSVDGDHELNLRIVKTALRALTTKVDGPTIFDPADTEMREVAGVA